MYIVYKRFDYKLMLCHSVNNTKHVRKKRVDRPPARPATSIPPKDHQPPQTNYPP